MANKILTPDEAREWRRKIKGKVSAEPLAFSKADEATSPFFLEVTNGQHPDGRTLVIHVFKRADIVPERAIEIVQHALTDVFGRDAALWADCDYRNVTELRKSFGDAHLASEVHDSLTVIFRPGPVALTRTRNWVRDQMAAALRRWYGRSLSW